MSHLGKCATHFQVSVGDYIHQPPEGSLGCQGGPTLEKPNDGHKYPKSRERLPSGLGPSPSIFINQAMGILQHGLQMADDSNPLFLPHSLLDPISGGLKDSKQKLGGMPRIHILSLIQVNLICSNGKSVNPIIFLVTTTISGG